MGEKYYVKRGKKYEEIGVETPRFLSNGIWLVDRKERGNSEQLIAKIGEIQNNWKYGQMVAHSNHLSAFIRAKINEYFHDTFEHRADGSFRYKLPPANDMAKDILLFLSMTEEEKKSAVAKAFRKHTHVDDEGNVLDSDGKLIFHRFTKEALATKVKQLKEDLEKHESLLAHALISSL